jgi:hypothetical protein
MSFPFLNISKNVKTTNDVKILVVTLSEAKGLIQRDSSPSQAAVQNDEGTNVIRKKHKGEITLPFFIWKPTILSRFFRLFRRLQALL